ncbi:hypothetical protein M0R88_06380 [Halorussus gelatinilyticus]|uniref:Uncharacterized protein n=1 Tax=Halorussus gelatinilyticus TaxID=2937524 RepID=A0A8U0INH7_9EURY|nr:hypothetical protein [Halorussus gelatinilyticus]UPW01724.1 hypothetical protein M0R88_06380 [Halorussus gelatinilyticus]
MVKSPDSTANCPHCDASLAHLRRGCDACERRVSWDWTEPCPTCDAETDVTRARCRNCETTRSPWDAVVARVLRERHHVDLHVAKDALPSPASAGFVLHTGDPRGQRADYRRPLPDGKGVHVKEFADHYAVHWDKVDPTEDFLGHVLADAPHWLLFGGVLGAKLARWPVGLGRGLAAHIKS